MVVKMINFLIFVIAVIIFSIIAHPYLKAQDCVPKTFEYFAGIKGLPVIKASQWEKFLDYNLFGTNLESAIKEWNKRYPHLTRVYSLEITEDENGKNKKLDRSINYFKNLFEDCEKDDLKSNYPYIWIGITQGGMHMAVCKFVSNQVVIINPNADNWTEYLSRQSFWNRTIFILDLKSNERKK